MKLTSMFTKSAAARTTGIRALRLSAEKYVRLIRLQSARHRKDKVVFEPHRSGQT
jgi:hypothetical protein